ncbi:YidB family protein [Rhizobium sp. YTU87027]|uniref:YidB family protein n=1 Tax=Rhizobium sp. YTU87027 TaxID=3417741 RepID=UPI003D69FAD7
MGIFDDAVPGGNISKPIMIALGALLVGKLLGGGGSQTDPAAQQTNPQAGDGGLLGGLGGLGGLLGKLTEAGQGDTVDSWVQPGQNRPIAPGSLNDALGSKTISDLARQAGISEQELLNQLSTVLPGVVDKLTPRGQLPTQEQIAALFHS